MTEALNTPALCADDRCTKALTPERRKWFADCIVATTPTEWTDDHIIELLAAIEQAETERDDHKGALERMLRVRGKAARMLDAVEEILKRPNGIVGNAWTDERAVRAALDILEKKP